MLFKHVRKKHLSEGMRAVLFIRKLTDVISLPLLIQINDLFTNLTLYVTNINVLS